MLSSLLASALLGSAYFGGSFFTMRMLGVEASIALSTSMLIGASGWLENCHADRIARKLQKHHGQHDEGCPHCGLTKAFMEWVERAEHEGRYVTRHTHSQLHLRRVQVLNPPQQQSNTMSKSDAL